MRGIFAKQVCQDKRGQLSENSRTIRCRPRTHSNGRKEVPIRLWALRWTKRDKAGKLAQASPPSPAADNSLPGAASTAATRRAYTRYCTLEEILPCHATPMQGSAVDAKACLAEGPPTNSQRLRRTLCINHNLARNRLCTLPVFQNEPLEPRNALFTTRTTY